MREIDALKYRSSEPVGRRAQKIYRQLRPLVEGTENRHKVRESAPAVTLEEIAATRPTLGFFHYETSDDRIIGCAHAYLQATIDRDVRFLSHDAGAIATARQHGLPFIVVPDEWRRKPQPTAAERRVAELERENMRLLKAEPQFAIELLDAGDAPVSMLTGELDVFAALTSDDVSSLIERLKREFPIEPSRARLAEGTVPYTKQREQFLESLARHGLRRSPAAYEKWLRACEGLFRTLHQSLQEKEEGIPFTFRVANDGTRPAKDALIEMTAQGPTKLRLPLGEDDLGSYSVPAPVRLPEPPKLTYRTLSHTTLQLPTLHDRDFIRVANTQPRLDRLSHDPNGFYYKPNRPVGPVEAITLECTQWRHAPNPEYFSAEVYVDSVNSEVKGSIVCRIQAENLSGAKSGMFPVHIAARPISIRSNAEQLIDDLVAKQRGEEPTAQG